MGLSDRQYYRDEEGGNWLSARSMVVNLILLNVAVYVAQKLFGDEARDPIISLLGLQPDLLSQPWRFWELLTYGFVHDPRTLLHIVFNMFGLWLFGSDLEQIYGRTEFLRFYLTAVVVAGLAWLAVATATHDGAGAPLVGASGGVMGLMMLFVLHFPRRMFYVWGIIPLPAWGLGVLYVASDLFGATQQNSDVAHVAHLAGAGFGALYFFRRWNLGRIMPRRFSTSMFRLRPRLKIHDPQSETSNLNEQVDAILQKISETGESSLTKKERRTLEEASRRYQRRRQ